MAKQTTKAATATATAKAPAKAASKAKQTAKAPAKAPAKNAQAGNPAPATVAANLPKCAGTHVPVAKVQPAMLRKIAWIGVHPGRALRIRRWHNYKVGMTLQHCRVTAGLDHLDVLFYVDHGLMRLADPTAAELEANAKAWDQSKAKALADVKAAQPSGK